MKKCKSLIWIFLFYALAALGDTTDYSPTSQTDEIKDPYENWNRKVFQVNLFLDKAILRPAAAIYDTALPKWGQNRVSDFTANLKQPLIFLNYLLQGNFTSASSSFWRFFINSTLGIGGLFDISSSGTKNLSIAEQDFGLTAAHYGVNGGPYIMLPIFGPSTVRDTGGLIFDFALDPVNYFLSTKFLIEEKTISLTNTRNENREFLEHIEETSMDPYATIRSLYIQKRIGKPKGVRVTPNYDEYYYDQSNSEETKDEKTN